VLAPSSALRNRDIVSEIDSSLASIVGLVASNAVISSPDTPLSSYLDFPAHFRAMGVGKFPNLNSSAAARLSSRFVFKLHRYVPLRLDYLLRSVRIRLLMLDEGEKERRDGRIRVRFLANQRRLAK